MSIPNIGPELPDPGGHEAAETQRRGNASLIYRVEPATDEVRAASTRASVVTHRFGGVRYALCRPGGRRAPAAGRVAPADGGESDEG
ncbi:hypothetical protein [Krasilnikovia sp. MM14-A1259]|uniref:hypothetical protein n=1 Tax=Krasilnikovia sp. MM14-A1259 TaxID=3373539 RepID=UPI003803266F